MVLAGAHAGPDELARFRREAEAVARLQHPNIVQIHEVGEYGGLPFFTLELVEGGTLERKLAGTPLPAREAAGLVETLARAVQAAHEKGVVHRDLKPANVLLTADGQPKVAYFGLSKRLDQAAAQTGTGTILGTPSYMAPEQAAGKLGQVGPAADVYALGAILYECLTGRPPFRAETPWDTVQQVVSAEPVPPRALQPKVPRDLETVCLKCLGKEPSKRYASAAALAEDLHAFLADRPIQARRSGTAEHAWRWCRRIPPLAGLMAAAAVFLLAALTATSIGYWRVAVARADAEAKRQLAEQSEEAALRAGDEEARQRRAAVDRLSQLNVANGVRLMDEGDVLGALPWLVEALRLDQDNPERAALHRRRLGAVLQRADGGAAGQGDGLDALAGQVGEQTPAVAVEVAGGAVLEEAAAEAAEERGERGAELSNVRIGHGGFPPGDPLILLGPRTCAVMLGGRGASDVNECVIPGPQQPAAPHSRRW
jgi:hypothetical protein